MKYCELKHIFTGFPDKDLEKTFIKSSHNPKEMRWLLIIGLLFYVHFLFLDYSLYKDYFKLMLILRLGFFMPITFILFGLSFTHFYERTSYYFLTIIEITGSYGIIFIEYITRNSQYSGIYYYGIFIALLFYYGTGKTTIALSLATSLFIAIPAILVESIFVETDPNIIMVKIIFLSLMILGGNFTGGIIQFASRSSFLKQCKIEALSMTDPLTGLKNRLFFTNIIEPELSDYIKCPEITQHQPYERLSDKNDEDCYGIMLLDIDHFKRINDLYGHETGDLFLQEFSRRIIKIIRSEDVFIRWGGEEFLLLLRHSKSSTIRTLSNRIKQEISDHYFILKSQRISATVSGGVLSVPPKSEEIFSSIENMIDLADQALYESKHKGRNRFTECLVQKDDSNEISWRPLTE